ncbi:MAG: hypothetical protein JMDDDDMK_03468 [Acidobacteria bacterium]|nr:hypothetical protein [Acidobacteriota bacterium]
MNRAFAQQVVSVLRDEFLKEFLFLAQIAPRARDFSQMPNGITRERRIAVDDAQKERPRFVSGISIFEQARKQIIVIVAREHVGVIVHHPAQQRFSRRLVVAIQRRAQLRMLLPERFGAC